MYEEQANCGSLSPLLNQLGKHLDQFLLFEHPDAMHNADNWKAALGGSLPEKGIGAEQVIAEMGAHLIPNGSQIPKPSCTAFITTGATSIGVLATLSGAVAAPQRLGLTAFNFLEALSLQWMAEMFELPSDMKGVYSSGGSVANLIALGAARQWSFEQQGSDPARDGLQVPCRIYASSASHHTIHRSAAVLGMGRNAVTAIPTDKKGLLDIHDLRQQLQTDANKNSVPVAIIANAGSTGTGSIDPLLEIGEIAREHKIWFHIDGAYGLPGILDPQVRPLYEGLSLADSITVDPHKWLGAPVGIGATYVRGYGLLQRAFTQEEASYLEVSCAEDEFPKSSMDSFGIPYFDFGVELSAPSRGAVVWALIKEIGKSGLRERVCRHNAMAQKMAEKVRLHPDLELIVEPMLSVCCFRYVTDQWEDLNELNRRIHQQLVTNGKNIPSTTVFEGKLAIRPCFVGARTTWHHADDLMNEVIEIGNQLVADN